jgi:hypothetical protein
VSACESSAKPALGTKSEVTAQESVIEDCGLAEYGEGRNNSSERNVNQDVEITIRTRENVMKSWDCECFVCDALLLPQ